MKYQYQIDYDGGCEDAFLSEKEETREGGENPAQWLAAIESDVTAVRGRVMLGSEIIEECVLSARCRCDGFRQYGRFQRNWLLFSAQSFNW